jgi:MFS family permease
VTMQGGASSRTTGMRGYRRGIGSFSGNAKLFIVGGLFNGLGMSVFGLLFNLYLKELGYTESGIGQVLAAGSLGAALAAVPAGLLIERVSMRSVLIWSTLLASGAYALQAVFHEFLLLRILSFTGVLFITFYRIAASPFLMSCSEGPERIYLFSVNGAAGMFSSVLGFLLGGSLPHILLATGISRDTAGSQQMALFFAIAASLLSLIPFMRIRGAPPCRPEHTGFVSKIRSYDWPTIVKLMVPKVLVGLGAGLVIPFMNLYFRNVFSLDSARIGVYFSIMQVGLFLGMLGAPLLTKRFGMVGSIVLTELASVPFMLVLAQSRDISLVVAAFVMRGALMNMNLPIAQNFEMELIRERDRPFTNAVSSVAWNGAWTVSAAIGGSIIQDHSFAFSFYITIGFYLLSALSYWVLLGASRGRCQVS